MALPNVPLNIPIPKVPSNIVAPPASLQKKPIQTKPVTDDIKIAPTPQVLESIVDSYTRISKMIDYTYCTVPNLYVSYRYPINPNFAIIPTITFASKSVRCYLDYVKPKYHCEAVVTSAYNFALHLKGKLAENFDARVGLTYQNKQTLPLTTKLLLTYRHNKFATDFIYRNPSYFSTTFLYRLTEVFAAGGEFVISHDKVTTQGKTGETVSSFSKELYNSFALFGRYSDEANTLQSAICHTHKDYGIKLHYLRTVNDNTKMICTYGFTVDKQTKSLTSDARIGYDFHLPHQNTSIKGFYSMNGTCITKVIEDIGNNSFLSFEALANPIRDAYAFQVRLSVNGMPPQPSSFYSPSLHENSMMY